MYQASTKPNRVSALVALGANQASDQGAPQDIVRKALEKLSDSFGDVTSSNLYETPAFPAGSGPNFCNAACIFTTNLPPQVVLEKLHHLEAEFSRTRDVRWGQRTLDLDLIGYGDQVLPDAAVFDHWRNLPLADQMTQTPDQLILPHPRLQDRAFVLVPLCDVAPDWRHPVLGQTVSDMRDDLPPSALSEVVPL